MFKGNSSQPEIVDIHPRICPLNEAGVDQNNCLCSAFVGHSSTKGLSNNPIMASCSEVMSSLPCSPYGSLKISNIV